jgi:hypothetical protein
MVTACLLRSDDVAEMLGLAVSMPYGWANQSRIAIAQPRAHTLYADRDGTAM